MSVMDRGGKKAKSYDNEKVDNLINAVLTSCDDLLEAVVQVVDYGDNKNLPMDTEKTQQMIREPVEDNVPSPNADNCNQIRSNIHSKKPLSSVVRAKEKKNLIYKVKIATSKNKSTHSPVENSSKTKEIGEDKFTSSKRSAKNIDKKTKTKKSSPTCAKSVSSSERPSGTSEPSDQKLKSKTGSTLIGPGISIRSGTGSGEGKRSYLPGEAARTKEGENPAIVDVQKDSKNASAKSRQTDTLTDFVETPEKLLHSDERSGRDPSKIQESANSPDKKISTMSKNVMKKSSKQNDKSKSKTPAQKAKCSPSGKKVNTKKVNKNAGLITWCCPSKTDNKKLQTDPKSKTKNISTNKSKTGQVTKKIPHLRKEPKRTPKSGYRSASKSKLKSKSKSKNSKIDKKPTTKNLTSTKSETKSKKQNKPENKKSELTQKSECESANFEQKSCISTKTLKSTDNSFASLSKAWSSGTSGTDSMKKVESATTSAHSQSTKSTTSFTEIDNRVRIPNETSLLEIYGTSNTGSAILNQRTSSSHDNSNPRKLIAEMALEIQNHQSLMKTPNTDGTINSAEALTNVECSCPCPSQTAKKENSCPKIEQNSFPTNDQPGSSIVKDDHTYCTSKHCLHRNDDDPFSETKIIYRPPILNLKSDSSKSSNLVSSASLENQSHLKPRDSHMKKNDSVIYCPESVQSKIPSTNIKDNAQQFPVSNQYIKKHIPKSMPPSSTTISSASDSNLLLGNSNQNVQSNPEFFAPRSPSGSQIIHDYANEKASISVRDAMQSYTQIPTCNIGCTKKISSDTIVLTQEMPNCVKQSKIAQVPQNKISTSTSTSVQRTPSFNFREHSLEMKTNFRNFIIPYVSKQAFYEEKIANLKSTLSQEKFIIPKEPLTKPETANKSSASTVAVTNSDFHNILEPNTNGNVSTKFLDTPEFHISNTIIRETPFRFYISTTVDINEKPPLNIPSKCHNYEYTVDTFPKDGPTTNPALVVKMKKCEGARDE